MLYAVLGGVISLRDFSNFMLDCEWKPGHFNLDSLPKISTLSDVNADRSSAVFATIFHALMKRYAEILSDNSSLRLPVGHLKIVDTTTISLYGGILEGVGRNPIDGIKFKNSI